MKLSNMNSLFFRASLSFMLIFQSISLINAQCTGPNIIEDPEDFQWTYHPVSANNPEAYYSGTMEVKDSTFTFSNGETLRTRAYRQKGHALSIPGPTLRMTPGNKYVLSLHNLLPYEMKEMTMNVYKDPNIVNLHTHGLHISGESPGDDVHRSFEGGRGGDFVYDIPADHMGGTFWYHAHHHGATTLQVSGGMLGMIVIEDGNDGIPAPVAAMEEKLLQMAKIDPTVAGLGGDTLIDGTMSGVRWTVNGIIGGQICMPPNTWQHWRVSIADPMAMLRDLSFGPECEVMVLARDGVWRTVAPLELADNTLKLTGASRADFAIRASGNSTITMGSMTIATIAVDGVADPAPHPFDVDGVSQWSANRPTYLRDLRGISNVHNESISMGARTVNGSKMNHMVPNLTLPTTDVQEWSLSGNVRHPFHLHIYHVQALEDDRDFEAGEYYDVVASQMDVRFDLNAATSTTFSGATVMHCHILEHEDLGAMGWLDVIGGQGPPTFPADGDVAIPYEDYYIIGAEPPSVPDAPTDLLATTQSYSNIELTWTDNADNEDGFVIERSEDGINFNTIHTSAANQNVYNDGGLTEVTTYFYRISAYNAVGSSDTTAIVSATTDSIPPPTLPNGASNLVASDVSDTEIVLNWTDNADNENGYRIERSLDGVSFSTISTLNENSESFSDVGLQELTTYYYRVFAFNDLGDALASNTAQATTQETVVPNTIYVGDISIVRQNLNGNRARAEATILVLDSDGQAVPNADVSGIFTGPSNENKTGTTGTDGMVTINSKAVKNPNGFWCFEVSNLSDNNNSYDPNSNIESVQCETGGQASMNIENMNSNQVDFIGVYPNPLQKNANIIFYTDSEREISFEVYTLLGQKIQLIESNKYRIGKHEIQWENSLINGTYLVVMKCEDKIEQQRILILE